MRNIRNRKGGSRKGASTRNRKRGTISSENINRRKKRAKRDRIEESEVIWKEAPESRYHEDVPDYAEGGGRAVLGESVTELAVSVEGEPVAASRPRR
jgi:hypothetical protein